MKRRILIPVFACIFLLMLLSACEYERMTWQPSYGQYEGKRPPVVAGAVPIDGGEAQYRLTPVGSLKNPVPADQASINSGQIAYGYFCIQCHGSRYNGEGTVGQSFYPLPADLRSPMVQSMTEDELFRTISYGKNAAPPLWYTIAVKDRWHIINFIRSLGLRPNEGVPNPSGDFDHYQKNIKQN